MSSVSLDPVTMRARRRAGEEYTRRPVDGPGRSSVGDCLPACVPGATSPEGRLPRRTGGRLSAAQRRRGSKRRLTGRGP